MTFRIRMLSCLALAAATTLASASAGDWPTWRHDAGRSGYTDEVLAEPGKLTLRWSYHLTDAPRPAWPRSERMTFDRSAAVIAAEGLVFFGGSVDGSVRALDAESGKTRWTFPTRGPVRFAPAYADGRLFAVSDDGFLYCLKASDGSLLWKKRGGPSDEMILGNGRMISRWPARGGAVIYDGVLYFAAGIWPSDGVSLYALDPASGKTLWINDTAGSIYLGQPHGGAFAAVDNADFLKFRGNAIRRPFERPRRRQVTGYPCRQPKSFNPRCPRPYLGTALRGISRAFRRPSEAMRF